MSDSPGRHYNWVRGTTKGMFKVILARLFFWVSGLGFGGVLTGLLVQHNLLQSGGSSPTDWITGLGGLGVGGAIAGLVLSWKRQDDVAYSKQLETMFARLDALTTKLITVIENNTVTAQSLSSQIAIDQREKSSAQTDIKTVLGDVKKVVDTIAQNIERRSKAR